MGFPRDYLDFTTWYLQKKNYITRADNSDFTLTAEGVDYIESQRGNLPVLNKLLTDGKVQFDKSARVQRNGSHGANGAGTVNGRNGSGQIILPSSTSAWLDRRQTGGDRRNKVVLRMPGSDRRAGARDRRVNLGDRRQNKGDRRTYALVNAQEDSPTTRVQ